MRMIGRRRTNRGGEPDEQARRSDNGLATEMDATVLTRGTRSAEVEPEIAARHAMSEDSSREAHDAAEWASPRHAATPEPGMVGESFTLVDPAEVHDDPVGHGGLLDLVDDEHGTRPWTADTAEIPLPSNTWIDTTVPGAEPVVGEIDTGQPVYDAGQPVYDAGQPVPDTDVPGSLGARPLPRVMAVANQKGGVGKTTTTVNLGAALAELGYRVLVIDLDPQGNATTGLGIDPRNFEHSMYDVIMRDTPMENCIEATSVRNLFVVPATIDLAGVEIELVPAFSRELRLRRAIAGIVDDFDFVLIDCPPSLGLITINGLAAAAEVLVPIQCEYYALEGLGQLLRNVHLVASNLNEQLEVSTIVLTMYDARTRLAVDVATEVRKHFTGKVCRSVIPRTIRLSEAPSFGQPITVFDPTSRGAVAYRELAKEVSDGAPKRTG
jgi:chromosome partitioning protein